MIAELLPWAVPALRYGGAAFLILYGARAFRSAWRGGEALNSVVYRSAVTSKNGIGPVAEVLDAMGATGWNPPLPDWVQAWADVEAMRQWPPEDLPRESA